MAIYMHINGVPGTATAQGYENWVAVNSINLYSARSIYTEVGEAKNRSMSVPNIGEFEIIKPIDSASPLLFHLFCAGTNLDKVRIATVSTGDALQPYLEYTLSNVVVSSISRQNNANSKPYSVLSLNYTKIEEKFTPYDANNRAQSPVIAGYNVETAEFI